MLCLLAYAYAVHYVPAQLCRLKVGEGFGSFGAGVRDDLKPSCGSRDSSQVPLESSLCLSLLRPLCSPGPTPHPLRGASSPASYSPSPPGCVQPGLLLAIPSGVRPDKKGHPPVSIKLAASLDYMRPEEEQEEEEGGVQG